MAEWVVVAHLGEEQAQDEGVRARGERRGRAIAALLELLLHRRRLPGAGTRPLLGFT